MRYQVDRLVALLRDLFQNLPRRVVLTVQYHGWRELLVRIATFPLRLTPWGGDMAQKRASYWAIARRWYRREGRKVAVVIPHYGDPTLTIAAVESIQGTTRDDMVEIVVADDGTPDPQHVARLRAVPGIKFVRAEANAGFAANANNGIRAAGDLDVVLLNNDVIATPGWLEKLQYAAYRSWAGPKLAIVGPKLLYPDGTIQSAGSHRNLGAPEWFDHRYRFKPADHGPANIPGDVLAVTGAAMYLKRAALDDIGLFDEGYGMAYEDVDLCLRAWDKGYRVAYAPDSTLIHHESKTRPVEPGRREIDSQRRFWELWGDWLDRRDVYTDDGALRIVYVTEDTGIGGGHRVVFQHLNHLKAQGHDAELWTLEKSGGAPDWFDLQVPVRTFETYNDLLDALEPVHAIKVATWWNTAPYVWRASLRNGIGVFHVQDIETTYYPNQPLPQNHVLASYRHEFRYIAGSRWIADRLREFGVEATVITPGVDPELWHPLPDVAREDDVLLSLGRTNPLKNFPLTADGWQAVREDKQPRLWLFGIEPELADELGERAKYFTRPSDAEVNELYNRATALIQTSRHEGFCLPLIEAMATGAAVICTDSNGNRDFISDGENCLVVKDDPASVAAAIERLFGDADLRARLGSAGRQTARDFTLRKTLDSGEAFFEGVAAAARARDAEAASP